LTAWQNQPIIRVRKGRYLFTFFINISAGVGGKCSMEGKRLTSYAMEELECPKCGHKHSLKKYKVINVTEKAKLKEEIMKNRLYQFSCEECEYMAPLTYDSLYVDSRRNIMIYMAPVMNAEIKAEIAELEQEKGIDKRLVDNINDLKEKIMIADNHLDDRVIEIIKIMYIDQMKKEMEDDTLLNILFDYNRDNYCFLVFFQKKGIGKIPLTREFYRQVEDKYKDAIKEHSMDSFMKVDMEWAGKILFKNHNKFN